MLRIRPEQLDAFAAAEWRKFEDRLIADWRAAGRALPPHDALRARIRALVERASGHDLTDEEHAACFVRAAFAFGDGFDTDPAHPWAAQILGEVYLSPREKAGRLGARAAAAGVPD